MEIRTATEGDLDGLVHIQRQTQELHHTSFPSYYRSPADEQLREAMREFLAADETTVWIALVEAVPVGFLVFTLVTAEENAFCHARGEGRVDQLSVDEQHQRHGVGRALLSHAEQYAKTQGCNELRLDVLTTNETARLFYRAAGLTPVIERWRKEL
jgi:ribosomal protein S18 acetylase RimI-like enzyme